MRNIRSEVYLSSEAMKRSGKEKSAGLRDAENETSIAGEKALDRGARFIPAWVKAAVAFALGLGTMVGWKRIVVTVGVKIGRTHPAYAQAASAEPVAMGTTFAAGSLGLPVSPTRVHRPAWRAR